MLIVSASNVSTTGTNSKSLQVSKTLKARLEGLRASGAAAAAEIGDILVADLRDYAFNFCVMCQECAAGKGCVRDGAFNSFMALWNAHDDVVLVVPHYAGIPSKLLCALEKMQETQYLAYCQGKAPARATPKRVMVIAHGGLTENWRDVYVDNLIKPLAAILQSVGCEVVNDAIDGALCFGVKKYLETREPAGVCLAKEDDDEAEREVIEKAAGYFSSRMDRT